MNHSEDGRKHLSAEILRIVDNKGVTYEEMKPGQALTIYAQDAKTNQLSSFTLLVVSVRDLDPQRNTKTATFQYVEGDFNFYNGEDPRRTIKIAPGTLMENGWSATFIPQTNITMSFLGGIGLGRDHSFQFINGKDKSLVAHGVEMLDIGTPSSDFIPPDIKNHLRKIESVKQQRSQQAKQEIKNLDKRVAETIKNNFGDHPLREDIESIISKFSPNGKIIVLSYLLYAQGNGVLGKAWEALQWAWETHFSFEHPEIRGDVDLKASSRGVLQEMYHRAGIKWPRPERGNKQENTDTTIIVLPENVELKNKLVRKAEGYQTRLQDPKRKLDAQHKLAVLSEVLKAGTVNIEEFERRLSREPWFDEKCFLRAIGVIADYCNTGGENVFGGTGLK